jgi:hypothetical protein
MRQAQWKRVILEKLEGDERIGHENNWEIFQKEE